VTVRLSGEGRQEARLGSYENKMMGSRMFTYAAGEDKNVE